MGRRSKIPNLPEDIVNSILLELPVKSLCRFKLTCKSWCCSIDDPDFIKSHLGKSSTDISGQKILLFDNVDGKVLSTEASISADSKVVSLDLSNISEFCSNGYRYLEVSSCTGLVLIYYPNRSLILWNPFIRKFKRIPLPPLYQQRRCLKWSKIGLAYDFVAADYMLLCIQEVTSKTMRPSYIFEIYSVKSQSWRVIDNISPFPTNFLLYMYNDVPVSFNGAFHMTAISVEGGVVISFHPADEKFIVTPVPSKCGEHLELRAFGDRVCLLATVAEEISIWSLEKDRKSALFTWNYITKFPTLGSLIGTPQCSGVVICVKQNGNILWRKYDDGPFIEYNMEKNEYTEFNLTEIPHISGGNKPLYVDESLVSVKIPWD